MVSVVDILELVGDVFLPLVLGTLEGLSIEIPCESLKRILANSAMPVSDRRICLQVKKGIIARHS